MDHQRVTVNQLSWRDLCPPLLLFRTLGTAIGITPLLMALLGVILTALGWLLLETVLLSDEASQTDPLLEGIAQVNRSPYKAEFGPAAPMTASQGWMRSDRFQGVGLIYQSAAQTMGHTFQLNSGVRRFCYFAGGGLWTLLVWSFFGCGITRFALMQYTREEPIGLDDAFDYAFDHFQSCFFSGAIPLLVMAVLTIPIGLLGVVMMIDLGVLLGGLLWFLVLLVAFAAVLALFGLLFGWPLMVAAISCEGQDSFDGMSRAFAYVFQRPLQFFGYLLMGVIFSGLCWVVVAGLVDGAIHTSYWMASWGSNLSENRMGELTGQPVRLEEVARTLDPDVLDADQPPAESTPLRWGRKVVNFWNAVARTGAVAFLYSMFWCLSAAMYLLMRKNLDDTEMDEIYLVDENRTFELPPLKTDDASTGEASGVPEVVRNEDAEGTSAAGSADDSDSKPDSEAT